MPAAKLSETYNVLLLKAGWSQKTNRFYAKRALQLLEEQFSTPSIGDFVILGEQTYLRLDLAYASHRTNRLYRKNDGTELWAEIQLLDTPSGRVVHDLYKTKNIQFDCLMTGSLNAHDEVVTDSVQFLRVIAYGIY